MGEAITNIFFRLADAYGVIPTVIIFSFILSLAFSLILAVKEFAIYLKTLLARKMCSEINPRKHIAFLKMDHIINHRLHSVNCKCVLRKRLYQDIMKSRISNLCNGLKDFVKQDVNRLSNGELYLGIEAVLDNTNTLSMDECIKNGIPERILIAINEKILHLWNFSKKSIKNYCYNSYLYRDNNARICAVLEMMVVMIEESMNELESTLGEFNGDIKELKYGGLQCQHCEVCIHEN